MKKRSKSSLPSNNFLPKLVKNKGKVIRLPNPLTNTPAETPRNSILDQAQTVTQVTMIVQPQGNQIDLIPETKNVDAETNHIYLETKNKNKNVKLETPEERFFKDSKAPETVEDVQNQLDSLQELQNHMFTLTDIINQIVSTNFSQIISDSNLHGETSCMYNNFRRFYSSATKYFTELRKIMLQNAEERKNKNLPLSDVRANSYSFCQKWKEINNLYLIIEENCLYSLYEYVSLKFKTISHTITEITTNNRKDTVHAESLLETGGKLRQLILGLSRSVKGLLLNASLHTIDKSLVNTHINDIKAFIQVYNNAHFREFPKSGCNSIDLSQYKSSVMATFSDIIKGLKASYLMKDYMKSIFEESTIIQTYLNSIIKSLNLPQTIIKTVMKSPPKPPKKETVDPFEKIKNFVGGYEVSVVASSKIEEFIDSIQVKLDIPADEPSMNVWDRLTKLQETFFRKIDLIKETEKDVYVLKKNLFEQKNRMTAMLEDAEEKSAKNEMTQKKLNEQLKNLREQLDKMTKENSELQENLDKKDDYILDMKYERTNKKNKECLERIGKKMGQVMNVNEKDFEFRKDPQDDIQDVDKMSIFVVQKRCKTCKEFKYLRRQLEEALKGLIDVENGETIVDAVKRLKNELLQLRSDNVNLKKENQNLTEEIQKLKSAILKILKQSILFENKDLSTFDQKTPEEICELLEEAIRDIEKIYQDKIAELNRKHQEILDELKRKHQEEIETLHKKHQEELKNKEKEMLIQEAEKLEEIKRQLMDEYTNTKKVEYLNKSTSTIFNDSNFITQDIINEINSIKSQLRNKQQEIEFKDHLLNKVQNWMKKVSEVPSIEDCRIDKSLDILMRAVENKPNPLRSSLSKATSELNHVGSELLLFATRMDKFLNQPTPNLDCEPLTVLNYILSKIDQLFKLIEQVKSEEDNFLGESKTIEICLKAVCKQAARLNEMEEINIDKLSLTQLAYQAQSLVDDLGNLDDKKRFIPVCEVNSMTKQMRKIARIHSIDPIKYLPKLSQCLFRYYNSFIEIENFEPTLNSLFKTLDFKKESIDTNSEEFVFLRERIFELNAIMSKLPENQMSKSLVSVLRNLITICSFLLSSLAFYGLNNASS